MGKRVAWQRLFVAGALTVAPGLWNPVWSWGPSIRGTLGNRARIRIDPRRIIGKVPAEDMPDLRPRYLIPDLAQRRLTPIPQLQTYRDVEDFATHGDDYAATRLFRWLKDEAAAGRPVNARGIVCDTEAKMLDYYQAYLALFRSLQRDGYSYRGPDEICFGIGAKGELVHMRHGTHRLVSAYFLGLPSISGYVTHADPAWVAACCARHSGGPLQAIATALREYSVTA